MPAEPGSSFLLKLGSDEEPDICSTVGGMKTTKVSINGDAVAISTKGRAGWRELLPGAGVRSVSVEATGIFTGTVAEGRLRSLALNGQLAAYSMTFESGEQLEGKFLLTRLEYTGDFDGERNYSISLESSGTIIGA